MSLTIFYTPLSKETLLSVFNFIEEKFGARSAQDFITKANKTIKTISTQPYIFKASPISKNVSLRGIDYFHRSSIPILTPFPFSTSALPACIFSTKSEL